MKLIAALTLAALVQSVCARFFWDTLIVEGQEYGNNRYIRSINQAARESYIGWKDGGDNVTAENAVRCNIGASESSWKTSIKEIKAGSKVGFKLADKATIRTPGPVLVYMSKAPQSVKFYRGDGNWFKVFESGVCDQYSSLTNGAWCSWDKSSIEFKIPKNIENGEYLIRVEHISLKGAAVGGARFYPAKPSMTKLFEPLKIGNCQLQNRLVMAPLTRYRATDGFVPNEMVKEYYLQRSCVPGTLIVSEATQVSPRFLGMRNAPGIWSEEQIAAWKDIVTTVHDKGCFIWCQLWAGGRASNPELARSNGGRFASASAVPVSPENAEIPNEMTEEEIQNCIDDFTQAARNAMDAGFDGIEVHAGNGYIVDQFLQDTCNKRTDRWGGSVENRSRFCLELMKSITSAIGPERSAVRFSPWSDFLAMGMDDPVPQFTHVVTELRPLRLAFIDLIEARIRGNDDADCGVGRDVSFLVKAWDHVSPVLLSGGFNGETAQKAVDETYKEYEVGIMIGRFWTSNPDLVFRIKQGVQLQKYNRATFYTPKLKEGYTDWPFSPEFLASTA
ncbi:Chanoclavine-I aldehyde reductase easA [Paramyrothecium foliicola]|nr:Chanoclavine-I aldehyde reductase easA [Paramyrothecium foliicola]